MFRLLLALFLATPCFAQFLWNEAHLKQVRESLQAKNSPYAEAFRGLESSAKSMLQEKDASVMDKKRPQAATGTTTQASRDTSGRIPVSPTGSPTFPVTA